MENGSAERVILVTGATSGIGRAVARRFAESSARVVALGRNRSALEEVEDEITRAGGKSLALAVDVTDENELRRALDNTISKVGRLDVLVNAAGHISTGSIEDTSLAAWDAMMNVNLRAVFQLMQMAAPHLIKTKGNIVNVSSVTGLRSFPGVLAYCVSKAGVDQLTRCAALELAAKGVRVNAVNPGVVITEIHKRGGMSEEDYANFFGALKDDPPDRKSWRSRGDRRVGILSCFGKSILDNWSDLSDRRRARSNMRALIQWPRLPLGTRSKNPVPPNSGCLFEIWIYCA